MERTQDFLFVDRTTKINKPKYLSPCGILGDQLLPAPNQRPGELSSLFMSAQRVDRFANPRFLIIEQKIKIQHFKVTRANAVQSTLFERGLTARTSNVISRSFSFCKFLSS